MKDSPLAAWRERDGQLLRLRLSRPKANIIDAEMIEALRIAFAEHLPDPSLKGVVLDADGVRSLRPFPPARPKPASFMQPTRPLASRCASSRESTPSCRSRLSTRCC